MGLEIEGGLGVIGGILLFFSIPLSLLLSEVIYGVPPSDILNPALAGFGLFVLIVIGIVMDVVSALVLVAVGALLVSDKGEMGFAVSMMAFGVLGMVFSIVAIGGIMGMIGGILGIVSGALSIKKIERQRAT